MFRRLVAGLTAISLLASCAASRTALIERGPELSNERVCRTYLQDRDILHSAIRTDEHVALAYDEAVQLAQMAAPRPRIGTFTRFATEAHEARQLAAAADRATNEAPPVLEAPTKQTADEQQPLSADEREYLSALASQVSARSLDPRRCEQIVAAQNSRITEGVVTAVVAAAVVGGVIYCAVEEDCDLGGLYDFGSTGYAWDQFYGPNGNLITRCRSRSSGQFASNSNCAGLTRSDHVWPGK